MDGSAWIGLFRRIPAAHHSTLVLATSAGIEIMVQAVLRLEKDFVIARGRLAGSTEGNRVLIIPYDQINTLSINKVLLEREVEAIFGKTAAEISSLPDASPEPVQPSVVTTTELAPSDEIQPGVEAPAPADKPPPADTSKASPPSKSLLLARLRARLSGKTPPA